MDVDVTIKATFKNFCDPSDLKDMNMDLAEFIDYMIANEGIIGLMDLETAEVIQANFSKD